MLETAMDQHRPTAALGHEPIQTIGRDELKTKLDRGDVFLLPGYYRDPDWSVRDVVAHLGTWLAETQVQFERTRQLTGAYYVIPSVDALAAFDEHLVAMPVIGVEHGE